MMPMVCCEWLECKNNFKGKCTAEEISLIGQDDGGEEYLICEEFGYE